MDDLLKEAIADAKAVRETALANAKMALEEAFTPKLKSMLSKKIQSEIDMDEQDDEEAAEEEPAEEEVSLWHCVFGFFRTVEQYGQKIRDFE